MKKQKEKEYSLNEIKKEWKEYQKELQEFNAPTCFNDFIIYLKGKRKNET